MPGVEAGPEVRLPPTEFGFVVKPLDVEVPVVPPLDCKLPPIEFGFVVKPLDVDGAAEPGVTTIVPDDVVDVPAAGVVDELAGDVVAGVPATPVVGRVDVPDTEPDVSVGGVGVTGGITVIAAGGTARGVTTSLLSTQSGPLRSMQAGTASGTLTLRSVVSAAIAGAAAAENAMNNAATRFEFIGDILLLWCFSSSRRREKSCTALCIGCRAGDRGFARRPAPW